MVIIVIHCSIKKQNQLLLFTFACLFFFIFPISMHTFFLSSFSNLKSVYISIIFRLYSSSLSFSLQYSVKLTDIIYFVQCSSMHLTRYSIILITKDTEKNKSNWKGIRASWNHLLFFVFLFTVKLAISW